MMKIIVSAMLIAAVVQLLHAAPNDAGGCGVVCPKIYKPVCGTNGKTYPNGCELRRDRICNGVNVHKSCDGRCPCPTPDPCQDQCPAVYKPVCGSDGKTYRNDCYLRKAICEQQQQQQQQQQKPRLHKQCDGRCPCPKKDPKE